VGTLRLRHKLRIEYAGLYWKKAGERAEKNQGERVVRDMIEIIKGSGRNVTTDNFLRPYH